MNKKRVFLLASVALLLIGFFLPWVVYGSRTASAFDFVSRLLAQGYMSNMGEVFQVIFLSLTGLAALGTLILDLMGKSLALHLLLGSAFSLALFLLVNQFGVFRSPGAGLFISLAGALLAVYTWIKMRQT